MPIPLWLPWAVVVASGLYSFFAPTEARGVPDLSRRAVFVVAVAVALGVSVDRFAVSERELYEATAYAAALSDGLATSDPTDRIGALAGERLGRDVTVESGSTVTEDDERTTTYEIRAREQGAAVCVSVRVVWTEGGPWSSAAVVRGSCQQSAQ